MPILGTSMFSDRGRTGDTARLPGPLQTSITTWIEEEVEYPIPKQ